MEVNLLNYQNQEKRNVSEIIGHPKTAQIEGSLRDYLLTFLIYKQLRMEKEIEDRWFQENS